MEKTLAELERVQTQILERISKLELLLDLSAPLSIADPDSVPSSNPICDSDTGSRLSSILRTNGVNDFSFKKVPADYYDWPFEARRDALGAASIDHLCKSIVLVQLQFQCLLQSSSCYDELLAFSLGLKLVHFHQVNTQAPSNVIDCSDRNNSKYYVVVVQYTARFNAETVKNFLYLLNNGQIAKKKFNLRLAPEDTSLKLTGFEHNAVTCIGMKTDIPVILDEAIVKLHPDFFWLGGGEVDLKLGIRTSEFIDFVKPFIVSCSGT
ncbi:uncharacterized protein LOC142611873 isoform X1 [Castanea sativa]|uniref:uncharacterized protein LOC142611873 isoform X1 n=1 Tax=Castanea sativa TaxID=21020 RepID=UPI003F64FB53